MRKLKAEEIEVRILEANQYGCTLFLYKDARCDQRILDETYGVMGWQRSHQEVNNNLFCTVSVWDEINKQWISKQDAGSQSSVESRKGHASDSFKRACVNWGIGRELYTAPDIWIALGRDERIEYEKDKYCCVIQFSVKEIAYKDSVISKLTIQDEKGYVRFSYPVSIDQYDIVKQKAEDINRRVKQIIDKSIINKKMMGYEHERTK